MILVVFNIPQAFDSALHSDYFVISQKTQINLHNFGRFLDDLDHNHQMNIKDNDSHREYE